ncbi:MAG: histidine--tRNA ligase [Clostridiales bacterium]|jgi:histidyl-tRNA synthetase|nr:histidine--tRNA ligase [Clostridiales bacterium]
MQSIQAPRGTKDVKPEESYKWRYVEDKFILCAQTFGYNEIRTPVFENTELFSRGIGDTTDVVQKEMYTFNDKGGRSITLRPEGTAGSIRSYIENNLHASGAPTKLCYIASCYRYEKPQAGRLREFHQLGIELLGSNEPEADIEVIMLAKHFLESVGLTNLSVNVNSIGCPKCKPKYNQALKDYFADKDICELCCERLDKNPMRVLDCKVDKCKEIAKGAPVMIDYLCDECQQHFNRVTDALKTNNIDYKIDTSIVRGLDYYTKTVFEFIAQGIGAQSTVCGGGRYDGLIEEMGGKPTGAVGFGLGVERLLLCLDKYEVDIPHAPTCDLFVANIGDKAYDKAMEIATNLRKKGMTIETDLLKRSVKAQMKYASKIGAKYSIVIGDTEVESGRGMLKNMQTGDTLEVELNSLSANSLK